MKKAMFVAVAAIAITARGAINVTASRDYVDKKVYTLQTNLEERIESAQPGDYSIVSNKAMHALQDTGGTIYGSLTVQKIGNPFTIRDWDSDHDFYDLIFGIYSDRWGFKHKAVGVDVDDPYIAYLPEKTGTIAFDDDVSGALGNATNYTDNATNNLAKVAHSGSYSDLSDTPTKLSQFQNDSGFITASTAPVKTVNSKTGNVTLGATDVGAIPQTGMVVNVTSGTMHFKTRLSVGSWPESYKPIQIPSGGGTGFAFGDSVRVEGDVSMALGTGALATNGYVFVWNGDDDRYYSPVPSISNPYASRYRGGFYVNPKIRAGTTNPLQNFWIGDTTLNDWIGILAPEPDLSGYLQKTGGDVTGDITFRASSGLLGGNYLKISKDGFETGVAGTPNPNIFSLPDKSGTAALTSDLQGYLPLDYFRNGQTIPMYWGDGTKLCDFGANWIGNLAADVKNNSDAIDAISGETTNYYTKAETDAVLDRKLDKSGGDMTGPLSVDTTQGVYRVQLGDRPDFIGGDGIWWTDKDGHSFSGGCGIYCVSLMGNLVIISEGNEIYLPNRPGTLALLSDVYTAIQQIAPDFTAKAYALNSLCTYDGVVYRCKDAYTATASSAKPNNDTTHWEAKKVSELFLPLTGGTMTGDIIFDGGRILTDPSGLRIFDSSDHYWEFYGDRENTVARLGDLSNYVAFVDAGAAIPSTGICLALSENYAYVTNAEEVVVGNVTNIVTTVTTNSYPVIALYKDGTKIWTSDPADESNIGWLIGLILALVGGTGTVLWRYFGKSKYTLKIDPDTGSIYYETED